MASNKVEPSDFVNLRVLNQVNAIVHFKIKKYAPMRKLIQSYCDRLSLQLSGVRFKFDGININENDTPASLNLEDGDTIEVWQPQIGGYFMNDNCVY